MEYLRILRKEKGLTMKELGKMVDVSESMIQMIEAGTRKPSFELLLKLGEALDCSTDELVYGKKITATESDGEEDKLQYLYDGFNKLSPEDKEKFVTTLLIQLMRNQ